MRAEDKIEWFGPQLAGDELARLKGVLDSNYLNDGPLTRALEARVAAVVGVPHCVAVTSGTAAIALALMAAGVGAGDEVLVPDLTFVATANAVRLTGATPVLVDVEPLRLCLAPEAVRAAVGPKTRAIVPVDVNGRGADYAFLEPFCAERGLALICDSAEALGSRYRGRALGGFGNAGCFSFSANKTITAGQGGMIATRDAKLHARLIELKDQGRPVRGTGGDDLHPTVGFNFKFTDLQAAVCLAQMDKLDERLAIARRRDAWYRDALGNLPGLRFPDMDAEPEEARQWTDVLVEDRAALRAAFDEAGVGHRAFWLPLHTQAPFRGAGPFPTSARLSSAGLWLPSRFDLTQSQVERTATAARKALRP
ncbi:MAG: DegT/DnrJ/EryC1/StrS family aminotransferase [Tagaea sp.]|nr:DegT/DnrJ/EryC1/StrS family aminotransferase [Tagaea sp.]